MILPGRYLISKGIVSNVRSTTLQTQACGLDLTLKRILTWTSPGTIDFDNSRRTKASAREISFDRDRATSNSRSHDKHHHQSEASSLAECVLLQKGAYLVEFYEMVDVPLNLMGQIFVRSSLFRSGALLSAGVMDSGYRGAVGGMLQVVNPHGLRLCRDARLAQLVFYQLTEKVEGYRGAYQGSGTV